MCNNILLTSYWIVKTFDFSEIEVALAYLVHSRGIQHQSHFYKVPNNTN